MVREAWNLELAFQMHAAQLSAAFSKAGIASVFVGQYGLKVPLDVLQDHLARNVVA